MGYGSLGRALGLEGNPAPELRTPECEIWDDLDRGTLGTA